MSMFDIPVVLFTFRRYKTVLEIVERVRSVKPKRLYIISDGPRNKREESEVMICRTTVENSIDWDCDIVRNYADKNRGVFDNIGNGARWVFQREDKAIFLEDDNLPEVTFFEFCRDLLYKYENDDRILWICGTNYLGNYDPEDGSDYVFTKHLLPCGWASWKKKFTNMYDGEMKLLSEANIKHRIKYAYENRKLFNQQFASFNRTKYMLEHNRRRASWDSQMALSIRANSVYGISPKRNQIKNIGVDSFAEHGGKSVRYTMTRRFTRMASCPMKFPLTHPNVVLPDPNYERKTAKIIIYPWYLRALSYFARLVKPLLGISKDASFVEAIRNRKDYIVL